MTPQIVFNPDNSVYDLQVQSFDKTTYGERHEIEVTRRSGSGAIIALSTGATAQERQFVNIFIERLWRSLKQDAIYLEEFQDGFQARRVISNWLCCANPVKDSPHESSMIAEVHEQLLPYKIQDDKLVVMQ